MRAERESTSAPESEKTSTSYARFLLEQHLGRCLVGDETADHVNDNKSDDRVDNLQVLPNALNARKAPAEKPSGLPRGVFREGGRFRARIRVDGRRFHLGYFDSPERASSAYEEALRQVIAAQGVAALSKVEARGSETASRVAHTHEFRAQLPAPQPTGADCTWTRT